MGKRCIVCDKKACSVPGGPLLFQRLITIFKTFDPKKRLFSGDTSFLSLDDNPLFCLPCGTNVRLLWDKYEDIQKSILELKKTILHTNKEQRQRPSDSKCWRRLFRSCAVQDFSPQVNLVRIRSDPLQSFHVAVEDLDATVVKEEVELEDFADNLEESLPFPDSPLASFPLDDDDDNGGDKQQNPLSLSPLFILPEWKATENKKDPDYRGAVDSDNSDSNSDSEDDEEDDVSVTSSETRTSKKSKNNNVFAPKKKGFFTSARRKVQRENSPDDSAQAQLMVTTDDDGKSWFGGIQMIQLPGQDSLRPKDIKVQCGKCNRVVKGKCAIQKHIKEVHLAIKRIRRDRRVLHKKKARRKEKIECDAQGNKIKFEVDDEGKMWYGGIQMIQLPDQDPSLPHKHVKFQCGKCARVVNSKYNCKQHIKEVHFNMICVRYKRLHPERPKKLQLDSIKTFDGKLILHGVEIKSTEDGKFECGECALKHKHRCNLINHIRWIHAKIPRPTTVDSRRVGPQTENQAFRGRSVKCEDGKILFCGVEIISIQDEKEKFMCGSCGHRCILKCNLMCHIKKHHWGNFPFKCDECDKSFAYLHLLRMHSVSHQTVKTEICDQCGKLCKQRSSLLEHIRRVHDRVINHTCQFCGKGFFGRKDFNTHLKTHTK